MIRKLNVRCCCTPRKVLGTLQIDAPDEAIFSGNRITLQQPCCHPTPDDLVTIQLRRFIHRPGWHAQYGLFEIAVYSEDLPLAFWRKVAGFTEGEETTSSLERTPSPFF